MQPKSQAVHCVIMYRVCDTSNFCENTIRRGVLRSQAWPTNTRQEIGLLSMPTDRTSSSMRFRESWRYLPAGAYGQCRPSLRSGYRQEPFTGSK